MIFTRQQSDLQHSINKMSVPVFVVDQDDDGEFRVVALNAAHTKATGLRLEAVFRKTPQMILPDKAEADFLTSRYRACVQQQRPIVYSTRLTYHDEVKEIRTTLHPVSLDGQAPTPAGRAGGGLRRRALRQGGGPVRIIGRQRMIRRSRPFSTTSAAIRRSAQKT